MKTKQNSLKNLSDELDSIFSFESDDEKIEFEERVLNSDVMEFISDLMIKHGIKTKAELSKKLGVSKAYVTKLFAGDKKFNANLLVKFQRIFDMRFKLVDKHASSNATYLTYNFGNSNKIEGPQRTALIPNNLNESNSALTLHF